MQNTINILCSFGRECFASIAYRSAKRIHKGLNLYRVQCLQFDLTQCWCDVISYHSFIGVQCIGLQIHGILRKIGLHPFSDRILRRFNIRAGVNIPRYLTQFCSNFLLRFAINTVPDWFAGRGIYAGSIACFPASVFSLGDGPAAGLAFFTLCHDGLLSMARGFRCYP